MLATQSQIEELDDYAELEGLIDPEMLPTPELSRCFVHRGEDGRIDGYCFIQPICVIEPIWVAPEQRRRGVAPKLFGEAIDALKRDGDGSARAFYCRSVTPEVEDYLRRLGMQEAGKAFVMKLGG
jgi:GNAT superfamily N-acetyltransferase